MRLALLVAVLACGSARGADLVEQGRALYNQNRFAEARALFQKALRAEPARAEARF